MERDRLATLIVRAALTGAVDFSKADPRDRWWWKRLNWILGELENRETRELRQLEHQHWMGLCSVARITEESFKSAHANAIKSLEAIQQLYRPWWKPSEESKAQTREGAIEAFREEYGRPGDPRYQKMLQEQAAAFEKIRNR